jgi:hypothetical protein
MGKQLKLYPYLYVKNCTKRPGTIQSGLPLYISLLCWLIKAVELCVIKLIEILPPDFRNYRQDSDTSFYY